MMKCLSKEAGKIQANEVAIRIEEILRGEWTRTEDRPQELIINRTDDLMAEASIKISETTEGAFFSHGDGSTETGSSTFGTNRNSIDTLLNPTTPTQSQLLSSVRSSSITIGSGAGLSGYGEDSTAGEGAELGSSRGEKRGLESQTESLFYSVTLARGKVSTGRSLHRSNGYERKINSFKIWGIYPGICRN
ncbi:hypothetical protein CJF32_00004686 [Rutstroemia sp. NJR-2017a WRK4]|nr:hypothetical protein CJF32_00004686 [Rutstroemia sp. NJR-2017a WRK4]